MPDLDNASGPNKYFNISQTTKWEWEDDGRRLYGNISRLSLVRELLQFDFIIEHQNTRGEVYIFYHTVPS